MPELKPSDRVELEKICYNSIKSEQGGKMTNDTLILTKSRKREQLSF